MVRVKKTLWYVSAVVFFSIGFFRSIGFWFACPNALQFDKQARNLYDFGCLSVFLFWAALALFALWAGGVTDE